MTSGDRLQFLCLHPIPNSIQIDSLLYYLLMENHQNTEQQSSEPSHPEPIRSKRRAEQSAGSNLLKLLQHSPWLIWIGIGAFLFTLIFISLSSIINIEYVRDEEPTPVVNANPTPSSPADSTNPLLLLGAVALGCATGSIAIARRRQIYFQFYQLSQRLQSASTKAITRRQQRQLLLQSKQQMLMTPLEAEKVAEIPDVQLLPEKSPSELPANLIVEEKTSPIEENYLLRSAEMPEQSLVEEEFFPLEDSQMLILVHEEPEAEDESLEKGTESLAEMLDIRKKLPLSAILDGSYSRNRGRE